MIERAVRLAQSASPTTSIVLLVAVNLIPLAGVLLWGWNVATLLVLYWVENGIVGVLNVPKMVLASGTDEPAVPAARTPRDRAAQGRTVRIVSQAGLIPFFLVHYGIFWFVHGIFVFALPTFAALRTTASATSGFPGPGFSEPGQGVIGGPFDVIRTAGAGPDLSAVAFAAIWLAISHTASLLINYVGRGEYRRITIEKQMFAPYGRLVILHLTILFGAFASLAIGSPVGAVVVLVVLKTVVDLQFHVREHRRLATASPTG
jgi:hypothetical protein